MGSSARVSVTRHYHRVRHVPQSNMPLFIIFLCLGASLAQNSVEFSDSDINGEIEFGKSVSSEIYSGLHENDVSSVSGEEKFLSNFKSLHNTTDLQAQASSPEATSAADDQPPSSESAISRSDSPSRVLRGAESDLSGAAALNHPLFTPFKHNKIDTADFSDCALQGSWKPIGVPSGHYGHHEDHQKEHFHSVAEGPEAFPSLVVPNHHQPHSPLDEEGLAFWNQFINEAAKNHHFNQHDKHPKKQKHHPHHKNHHHIRQQIRQPQPPPHPIQELDVFESIRHPPGGDINVLQIQEKPNYDENFAFAQNLVSNPSVNDLNVNLHLQGHQGNHQQQIPQQHSIHHDDFLSPPPAPHRFHQSKPPPPRPKLPPPKPKYVHKPHKNHNRVNAPAALRQPPPVAEHHHDSVGGNSFDSASDPSSFTCGHNHEHGTNYHTASYQVEGESDPSLLEDDIHGSNLDTAPIIVGQPVFEHNSNDLYNLPYPKQNNHEALDLEEEGTDTGDDEDATKDFNRIRPYAEKLVQNGRDEEATTPANNLETTAPQTFHNEQSLSYQKDHDKVKYATTASPNFDVGFDHSGYAEVLSEPFAGGSERFNVKKPFDSDHKKKHNSGSVVVVNDGHVVSHSEPNGFFSSQFPSFSEFNFPTSESHSIGPTRNSHPNESDKLYSQTPPTSFTDFSFPPFPSAPKGNPQKGSIAVFDHHPTPNITKTHVNPKRKRPHKHYEVSENSGEMIPLSAFFPPRKMPKQFDMRTPNLAVPKGKRPKSTPPSPPPAPPKFQNTVHFDGANMAVYQSHPRNKVTKIRLKSKPNRGSTRYSEPDFRRSLTIMSRIH